MRQSISGLLAAFAAIAVSAAPAMACGNGLFTGLSPCSPCARAYVDPCGQGYAGGYGYGTAGYGYERLPDQSPQYFYANQGPTFTGPGNYAPVPTYQEAAVSGWSAYRHGYHYGYDGGRYANATHHHYDGEPAWQGPLVQSYRWHGARHIHHHHLMHRMHQRIYPGAMYHHNMRYGMRAAPRYYAAPRYGYPRHTLRRYY
jgi:hypothetical protein